MFSCFRNFTRGVGVSTYQIQKPFRTRFRLHRRPGVFGASQGHGLPANLYKLDAVGFDAVVTTLRSLLANEK